MLREVAATALLFFGLHGSCHEATGPVTVDVNGAQAPRAPTMSALASPGGAPSDKGPVGVIVWETSEAEARERAVRRGVPLLVYAGAGWAAASIRMDREVWTDPRILRLAPRFVWLRLDLSEGEGDAELLAQRFGIAAVPATLVIEPDGRRLYEHGHFIAADNLARDLAQVTGAPGP